MSDFRPGVAATRKALGDAVRIVEKPHPGGQKGANLSLREIAIRLREGKEDGRVGAWASRTFNRNGRPKTHRAKAQVLLDEFRKHFAYHPDPVGTEAIKGAAQTMCLDDKGLCFEGGDCFPSGTLLLRDDYELVPIELIKIGDRIWGLDKWTTVQAVVYKGIISVDAIVLNNGSIAQLTRDHHVSVGYCDRHNNRVTTPPCSCPWEERRIERISVGDLTPLMVLPQPKQIPFGTGELEPDRAYVEGLFVSEGWSDANSRFCISGQDGQPKEAQKREVQTICEKYGIATRWHRKYIAVNDGDWTLRMQQMGSGAPNKHALSLNLNEMAARELLRGIMADSGANTNGSGRTFSTTSSKLLVQTRILHRMIGSSCSVRYLEFHGGLGKNPIWRLGIRDVMNQRSEKTLRVKEVIRSFAESPCWDIQTEDHWVYLAEHDVTVNQCDDLCVALGSACMTLGIPVRVLAQAFDDADIPSHVLFEIQTEQGEWLPVDPSSDSMRVGRKFPAKKEWRLDPMKDLEDVVGASGPSGGNFVGIGAGPGMGAEPSSEFQRMTSAELSEYLKTLELQVDSLGIAIDEVEKVRRIARPNSPYDVEFLVNETLDVSKFPTDGSLWTKGMSVVCTDMYLTGREMVRMGYQALEGKRKVLVDDKTGEVVFEGLTGDPWSLKTVTQSTTDAVFAFFGVNGTLLEGFTQKTGRVLSPNEVKGAAQAAGGTVQGVGWVFLAVIGAAAVAGLAALAIVAYGKHCDMAKDAARQASYQTLINCQREGKCSEAAVKQGLAIIADANIKTDEAAARKEEAADPYGLKALGKILMWVVIGGAAAAAVVTFSPVVRRAAEGALEDKEAKRKATAAASSGPPRLPSPPPRHPAMSRALLPARRAT